MRLLAIFLILIASCSDELSVPEGILPTEKLKAVLYDIIRADEMVDYYILQDSTYRNFSKRLALYDTVFQIHSLTKQEYSRSIEFYQQRPDILKEILEDLQTKADSTPPVKKPAVDLKLQ